MGARGANGGTAETLQWTRRRRSRGEGVVVRGGAVGLRVMAASLEETLLRGTVLRQVRLSTTGRPPSSKSGRWSRPPLQQQGPPRGAMTSVSLGLAGTGGGALYKIRKWDVRRKTKRDGAVPLFYGLCARGRCVSVCGVWKQSSNIISAIQQCVKLHLPLHLLRCGCSSHLLFKTSQGARGPVEMLCPRENEAFP